MKLDMKTLILLNLIMSTMANIDGELLKSLRQYLNRHNYQVYIGKGVVSEVSKGLMILSMTKIVDKFESDPRRQEESYIIDATTEIVSLEHLGRKFPSIAIFHTYDKMTEIIKVTRIDQQLYGLVLSDSTIHEIYTVNNVAISRKLAAFDEESKEFVRDLKFDSDFVERRSDLQGVHLKVFVCTQAPYLFVEPLKEDQNAIYEEFPDGLSLENISPERISGIFRDMQIEMERSLNFTSTYYNCHNRGWGSLLPNGSYTGMIGSLHRGHLDLISTSLTLKPSRIGGVSFLHPIGLETYILLLPSIRSEELDWFVFVDPFQFETWIILALNSLACAALMWGLLWTTRGYFHSLDRLATLLFYSLATYFSRPPPAETTSNKKNYSRLNVFAVSLCGVFVWAAYRASLTSHLSVLTTKMPFRDMEEFLKSDYQLIFMGGGAIEASFRNSDKTSVYRRVFDKNFKTPEKEEKFIRRDEYDTLSRFLKLEFPQSSLWFSMEAISSYKQYWCQFSIPYVSRYPVQNSMATPKSSPYYPFLNQFVFKQWEQGALEKINLRWKKTPPQNCLQAKGRALGPEKTVLLFAVWLSGCIVSTVLLVMECCSRKGIASNATGMMQYEREESVSVGRIKYGTNTLYMNSAKAKLISVVKELEESKQCQSDIAQAIFGLEAVLNSLNKRKYHLA